MLTVQFEDHTETFLERLRRRLLNACSAPADELADIYRGDLQRNIAPPHSDPGQIPHAYFGWKSGGYGPTNDTMINNPGQVDYLATYIDFAANDLFGGIQASIGFRPSHVQPGENYLLYHDANGRPWIQPIFYRNLTFLKDVSAAAFQGDVT